MQKQKKFCVCGHRESHQQDQHHLQLPEHFWQQAHGQGLGLNRPHLQQNPLKKAEMGFYAVTLGFDLSSITKVNAATPVCQSELSDKICQSFTMCDPEQSKDKFYKTLN
jgi:hypothetical protein